MLRPATAGDADLLLAWANDPSARAASLARGPIDRSTHLAWLADRLASAACRIWIGEEGPGSRPVGVVRFELGRDRLAVVSISIDASARGRGLGRDLLTAGLAAARAELRPAGFLARVQADNDASLALFERAGFRRAADRDDRVLTLVLRSGPSDAPDPSDGPDPTASA